MRNFVLLFCLLSILLAIHAAPQQQQNPRPSSTHRSPNPQVNLVRQGLIDKLCKNQARLEGGGTNAATAGSSISTTSSTSTTIKPAMVKTRAPFRRTKRATTATPAAAGPSCDNFNNLTFAELIEMNKKLLKPVPNRPN